MSQAELVIYVAPDRIEMARCERAGGPWIPFLPVVKLAKKCDLSALEDTLATVLALLVDFDARIEYSARLVVSNFWLYHCVVPWSMQYLSPRRIESLAREQMQAQGYEVDPEDEVRVDDAPWREPRAAIGYPGGLVRIARTLSASPCIASICLIPLAEIFRASTNNADDVPLVWRETVSGATCSTYEVNVSFARINVRGRLGDLVTRSFSFREGRSLDELSHQFMQRLGWIEAEKVHTGETFCLIQGLNATSLRALRCSPLSVALRSEPRNKRLLSSKALAGITIFVIAACFILSVLRAGSDSLLLESDRLSTKTKASPLRIVPPTKDELGQIDALNGAVRALNVQIPAVMERLIPPADIDVGVLSLELMTVASPVYAARVLTVRAEAPSPEDMTRYVSFLASKKPCYRAALVQHELSARGNGAAVYKFAIEVECNF